MAEAEVRPLSQEGRPPCSVPIGDADLTLNNANWLKGCQSMAEWCWTGNMIPDAVPGFLGQFFLQVPGVLENQLHFSTTLIFDEPSFRNGRQVSGFLQRVTKELLTNLIAQRRHCWYTANHHAFLGKLTAAKHGLSDEDFSDKWANLTEHARQPRHFTRMQRAALAFADAFATDPKSFTDAQYAELRAALAEDNQRRYPKERLWLSRLQAARAARAQALAQGAAESQALQQAQAAAESVTDQMPDEDNQRMVDAQVVEMAFHCVNYLTLSTVFTGLNIPDEPPFPDFMMQNVPGPVIKHINDLNRAGGEGMPDLVPPALDLPWEAIESGRLKVEPAQLRGARLTPISGDEPAYSDGDGGLTAGGAQASSWNWIPGSRYPTSLSRLLLHHPELARYTGYYEQAVTCNEDQWRNGVQTAGFVSRRLKELAAQKVCRLVRSRWAIDHFTAALYRTCLDEYAAGPSGAAREAALQRASRAALHAGRHEQAPEGVFSALEKVLLSWAGDLVTRPHSAYRREGELRQRLQEANRSEIEAGLRQLDASPNLAEEEAMQRLLHHQIAELAMLVGHQDAVCRLASILRLEAEQASGGRPGIHGLLGELGADDAVLSANELTVNPSLAQTAGQRLAQGDSLAVAADEAAETGEF